MNLYQQSSRHHLSIPVCITWWWYPNTNDTCIIRAPTLREEDEEPWRGTIPDKASKDGMLE